MSDKKNKLSELEIRELFHKYDINKDNTVDEKELYMLVRDIYIKNHNIGEIKNLTNDDEKIIKKSVQELLKGRDLNKDGSLQLEEFISYNQGKDIVHSTEKLLEENRLYVYGSRIARAMRGLNNVMIGSRPLAYASELGESVRPLVPRFLVRSLYAVSWAYVILDVTAKTYAVRDQGREKMAFYAMDLSIWHSLASMMFPALTIHSIVKYTGKAIKKIANPASNFGKFGPTILGLSSIPFIIHPLDHATDIGMDLTIRGLYSHKLPVIPKTHH